MLRKNNWQPISTDHSDTLPTMATVIVKMKFCDKTHRITAELKDDGDISIHIESDCDHVMDYAKILGDTVTISDVTDRDGSKVLSPESLQPLTLTCLAPFGVLDAAWLELGMMSKNRAREIGEDVISFEEV